MSKTVKNFNIPSTIGGAISHDRRYYEAEVSVTGQQTVFDTGNTRTVIVVSDKDSTTECVANTPRKGYELVAYNKDRCIFSHKDLPFFVALPLESIAPLLNLGSIKEEEFIFIGVNQNRSLLLARKSEVLKQPNRCLFDGIGLFSAYREQAEQSGGVVAGEPAVQAQNTVSVVASKVVGIADIPPGALYRHKTSSETALMLKKAFDPGTKNEICISAKDQALHQDSITYIQNRTPNEFVIEDPAYLDDDQCKLIARWCDSGSTATSLYAGRYHIRQIAEAQASLVKGQALPRDLSLPARLAQHPQLPLVAETGVDNFIPFDFWMTSGLGPSEALLRALSVMSRQMARSTTFYWGMSGYISKELLHTLLAPARGRTAQVSWLCVDQADKIREELATHYGECIPVSVALFISFTFKNNKWYAKVSPCVHLTPYIPPPLNLLKKLANLRGNADAPQLLRDYYTSTSTSVTLPLAELAQEMESIAYMDKMQHLRFWGVK